MTPRSATRWAAALLAAVTVCSCHYGPHPEATTVHGGAYTRHRNPVVKDTRGPYGSAYYYSPYSVPGYYHPAYNYAPHLRGYRPHRPSPYYYHAEPDRYYY